jgi:hypothetical protein
MGGHWSSEVGRSSRTERSNSSEVEGHRHHRDFIRDQTNKHRERCNQAIERGRNKMKKYQQQAELYQNKDRDTFEQFKKDFESIIISEDVSSAAYIISRKNDHGTYQNKIDVKNGKFIGGMNDHQKHKKNSNEFSLSEIAFNQICLTMEDLNMEMSKFNLKCWYGVCVTNEETKETVKLFFPEERGPDGKIKKDSKTFKNGEDGFIALAGTPTAQSKFYLLAQHPKAFPGKEVTSITVIRHSDGRIDIEYKFDSQWEQKEEASPNTSNTVVFGSRDSLE